MLAPIIAVMTVSLAVLFAPQFNLTNDALSDLGVIPGVTSTIFTYSLIISGILGLAFATSIYRIIHFYEVLSATGKPRFINRALGGVLFFPGACLALIVIGIFPETVGVVHNVALVAFFVFSIGVLGNFGIGFWQVRQKSLALFSFMLSAVFAVPWLFLLLFPYVSGIAIPEIISALAMSLWMVVFGYKMIKIASRPDLAMFFSEDNL